VTVGSAQWQRNSDFAALGAISSTSAARSRKPQQPLFSAAPLQRVTGAAPTSAAAKADVVGCGYCGYALRYS
jgi:hypothetical protein